METPLAKKSTLAMTPAAAEAVAVMVCATLTATEVPLGCEVMLTVGPVPPVTATLTVPLVPVLPEVSVATAVRAKAPAALGAKEAD